VIAGDLRLEFDLDAERLGLMTSAFFGALALAQLPLGVALDRWGPRRVVPAMMLAGAAGALVFASATTFATLTLGRALLGLGFAGVLVGSLQAFGAWFPERRFATVSGLLVGSAPAGRWWPARRWPGSPPPSAGGPCSRAARC
jgi:MFS family permease